MTFSMFPMNIKSVGATLGTTTETVTYQWPLVQHYTPGPGGDIGDRIYHGYMRYIDTCTVSVQVAWQI